MIKICLPKILVKQAGTLVLVPWKYNQICNTDCIHPITTCAGYFMVCSISIPCVCNGLLQMTIQLTCGTIKEYYVHINWWKWPFNSHSFIDTQINTAFFSLKQTQSCDSAADSWASSQCLVEAKTVQDNMF